MKKSFGLVVLFALLLGLALLGCSSTQNAATESASTSEQAKSESSTTQDTAQDVAPDQYSSSDAEASAQDAAASDKPVYAVIETNKGTIVFQMFPHKAPKTVNNFIKLANKGFYDGIKWHRVEPGFVIQGGDPLSKDDNPANDGLGGPGYEIKAEINDVPHTKGVVAMAHNAKSIDSAGSQFYITLADTPHLDGGYTVFGKVSEGMDVVESIQVGDVMSKVYIKQ
jgi:cyclophilin family peptidyl-prolyl cis-trans isomerase